MKNYIRKRIILNKLLNYNNRELEIQLRNNIKIHKRLIRNFESFEALNYYENNIMKFGFSFFEGNLILSSKAMNLGSSFEVYLHKNINGINTYYIKTSGAYLSESKITHNHYYHFSKIFFGRILKVNTLNNLNYSCNFDLSKKNDITYIIDLKKYVELSLIHTISLSNYELILNVDLQYFNVESLEEFYILKPIVAIYNKTLLYKYESVEYNSNEFQLNKYYKLNEKNINFIADDFSKNSLFKVNYGIKRDLEDKVIDMFSYNCNLINCVYVYDVVIKNNFVEIFLYEKTKIDVKYDANLNFEIKSNEKDSYIYSRYTNNFKDKFKILVLPLTELNLNISNLNLSFSVEKNAIYKMIDKEYCFLACNNKFIIRKNIDLQISKKVNSSNIYIFCDRNDCADDNAEVLYDFYQKNTKHTIYYTLSSDSDDYKRLEKRGFNLIEFGSIEHKRLFLNADFIISSHANPKHFNPFNLNEISLLSKTNFKFIFLQHGVIVHNHRGFLDRINSKIDLFITSNKHEQENVANFSQLDNIKNTGLCRFDNYSEVKSKNQILYAPSWNILSQDDLENSKYFKTIISIIENKYLNDELFKRGYVLKVAIHPEFRKFLNNIKFNFLSSIFISTEKYSNLISESKFLITDYSSIFFDFLYQKKKVISYAPYPLHHQNAEFEFHKKLIHNIYKLSELIDVILENIDNSFEYNENDLNTLKNDVFSNIDSNNCKRVFKEIEKLS